MNHLEGPIRKGTANLALAGGTERHFARTQIALRAELDVTEDRNVLKTGLCCESDAGDITRSAPGDMNF